MDAKSSKLPASPGSWGTVVHLHYVWASDHIDGETDSPPRMVSWVSVEESDKDKSPKSAEDIGTTVHWATVSSDKVNIGVPGDLELAEALSITEKGFPTATLGYDSHDVKRSPE